MEGAAGPRKLSDGTMLDDKYRIEHLLAVGGMGAVYLGTHIKLRKRVAIKVLNPQLSSPPMIERFHREAITASQIGHEGIAQVTDIGTSNDGEPFLVMEYLEGESLASRLRATGPLAIEDACELGCSILSPLAAAHRAGIVHRDLKPDNVFLVRQSRGEIVKLLDFGISRTAGADAEFRLTTTGLVLGTPYYMSPEQARGDSEITPAADLYAFGVILYEMLIGDVPIRAENYNQLMYRVMVGDFVRPREQRPDLAEPLERIILQAMAQVPQDRPASALDLEQALLMYCRPVFRERASGRMSAPGLPLPTPPPASARGTGSGDRNPPGTDRNHVGTDRNHVGTDRGARNPGADRNHVGTDRTLAAGGAVPAASAAPASAVRDAAGGADAVTSRERPGPAVPARRSRLPWIVLGAIILGAAIAWGVMVASRDDGAVRPIAPTAAPASAPTASPPPAPPPPPPVPAPPIEHAPPAPGPAAVPTTVTLRFAVEPAGAAITVDGANVTGTELSVRRDDAVHALRITAPGHIAHDEAIRFDESQRLVVQLKRAGGPHPGDRHKPRTDHDRIDSESPY